MHEGLSHSCSTNKKKSKQIIINVTLSQNYSADVDELSSTDEDKSECAINMHKEENNEITYDVTNYLNAFNVISR